MVPAAHVVEQARPGRMCMHVGVYVRVKKKLCVCVRQNWGSGVMHPGNTLSDRPLSERTNTLTHSHTHVCLQGSVPVSWPNIIWSLKQPCVPDTQLAPQTHCLSTLTLLSLRLHWGFPYLFLSWLLICYVCLTLI